MEIDLDALEAAAMACTPGPWYQAGQGKSDKYWQREVRDESGNAVSWHSQFSTDKAVANARYVAAANPAVVLEMIRRLRKGGV